jgi:hypothetical protein
MGVKMVISCVLRKIFKMYFGDSKTSKNRNSDADSREAQISKIQKKITWLQILEKLESPKNNSGVVFTLAQGSHLSLPVRESGEFGEM